MMGTKQGMGLPSCTPDYICVKIYGKSILSFYFPCKILTLPYRDNCNNTKLRKEQRSSTLERLLRDTTLKTRTTPDRFFFVTDWNHVVHMLKEFLSRKTWPCLCLLMEREAKILGLKNFWAPGTRTNGVRFGHGGMGLFCVEVKDLRFPSFCVRIWSLRLKDISTHLLQTDLCTQSFCLYPFSFNLESSRGKFCKTGKTK